jgi:hypothetical protein
MAINLEKRVEKVGIVLTKREIRNIPCQVKLAIDRSGSMDQLYSNHTVQDVVERILAIGMNIDKDKVIDAWAFHNDSFELTPATEKNIDGYVNREIIRKISAGGTDYAPVMKDIVESSAPYKAGFLGKLFGRKKNSDDPSLAIFITDGENFDEHLAEKVIKESQDKHLYWILIGIGDANFRFIKYLGDEYPNAGYFKIDDISKISDEDLYDGIICQEFADWVKNFKKVK